MLKFLNHLYTSTLNRIKRLRVKTALMLPLILLVVSACELNPDDPNCIGEIQPDGPAWLEKTVIVDATIGPISTDPAKATQGWVSANLKVTEGQKIGFYATRNINLCSEGRNYTFSPRDEGGRFHQVLVPYTKNWAGGSEESSASEYRETIFGHNPIPINRNKFTNGWYDTGIELSGEAAVSINVAGTYTSFIKYAGASPNGGWAGKANRANGNFPKLGGTSDALSAQVDAVINDTIARTDAISENDDLTDEEKQVQIDAAMAQMDSRLEALYASTGGSSLTAAEGKGLFVYIGQQAPSRGWFDAGNPTSHQQDKPRDEFFELFSTRGAGYFGLPPLAEDPFRPNKLFLRYADDFFNRPNNAVHHYDCPDLTIQTNFGRGERCIFPFFPPFTTSPRPKGPPGGNWVWSASDYYHAGNVRTINSYHDNTGGYDVAISYNCVGSHGRYLDAKIITDDGQSVSFGSPVGGYSYIEHNLLMPRKGVWGDSRNATPSNVLPNVPATGRLYFRVVDEDGNGDGDGNYANNLGAYHINVGTYVMPSESKMVSQFIYNLVIKPIRELFFGNDSGQKGAARLMFEKITGQTGYGPGLLVGIIRAIILLYITFYAIQFIFGFIEDTRTDFIYRLLRIAIILQLLHPDSWEFFSTYLFNAFIDGSLDLIRAFTSQFAVDNYGDIAPQGDANDPFAFFNVTFSLLGNAFFWKKLAAMFLSPLSGWIYLMFVFACMWWFFIGVVYAVYIYLMSIVIVAFLLALAPIFISMGLFQQTRTAFTNWLRQLTNYTMQPVMMLIAMAILNVFIYAAFYRIASMPICKTCILNVDLDLFEICLMNDFKIWSAEAATPNDAAIYAVSFLSVLVFLIIVTCMRQLSETATSLAASIFGNTPSGAITGKEAGLPKAAVYFAPFRAIAAKTGLTGAERSIRRGINTALLKDGKAMDDEYKKSIDRDKAAKSTIMAPFAAVSGGYSSAKKPITRGRQGAKLGSKIGNAIPIPGVGMAAGFVLGAAGGALGAAIGATETAIDIARAPLNVASKTLLGDDIELGNSLSAAKDKTISTGGKGTSLFSQWLSKDKE